MEATIYRLNREKLKDFSHPTNLDFERLCLEPITSSELKTILRSGTVRLALATSSGLRFTTITRMSKIAGRKAKRTKQGCWEAYEAGVGWITIPNDAHFWLHP